MAWDRNDGKFIPKPQLQASANDVPTLPNVNFDQNFDFQSHDWIQGGEHGGDEIGCSGIRCSIGHRHGHNIRGLMLVGSRGNWSLVKEGGIVRLKP